MISPEQLTAFKDLFQGQQRAYGVYEIAANTLPGEKAKGRARTVTLPSGPLPDKLWEDHLNGVQGLGVIPIRDDSTCMWGAIDIDLYKDFDPAPVIKTIYEKDLPLVPCRSKSGGLHLFCFLFEPVKAKLLIEKLKEMAVYLGYGTAEIFPKQEKVLAERQDVGNWINISYFDADKTLRYAFGENGKPLSLEEFISQAKAKRLNAKEIKAYTLKSAEDFSDGPPCLQTLASDNGFVSGVQHNGIFGVAVYCRMKFKEEWGRELDILSSKLCTPPMDSRNLEGIKKAIGANKYFYRCSDSPCRDNCNKKLCATRKYGTGNHPNQIKLLGVTKLETDPPLWFVEIEGHGRLELTTDEFRKPELFQKKCLEKLNQMPTRQKDMVWAVKVAEAMKDVTIITVPEEITPTGALRELLTTFCTRHKAMDKAEITMGKAFTEEGKTYFRFMDFNLFLERQKFTAISSNKVVSYLKGLGAEQTVIATKDRDISAMVIPEIKANTVRLDTPKIEANAVI